MGVIGSPTRAESVQQKGKCYGHREHPVYVLYDSETGRLFAIPIGEITAAPRRHPGKHHGRSQLIVAYGRCAVVVCRDGDFAEVQARERGASITDVITRTFLYSTDLTEKTISSLRLNL